MNEKELPNYIIDGKIELYECIGQGSHGKVFRGRNIKFDRQVAVKMIRKNSKELITLQREVVVLQELSNEECFSKLYSYGTFDEFAYIEIDLYESNLEQLKKQMGGSLNLQLLINIGSAIIERIKQFHTLGMIHRDIKPENFMMKNNVIYLIDFGLSKNVIKGGKHIEFSENKSLVGTIRYASINTHIGIDQTRRDDLESIAYLLLYLFRGSLPWQNLTIKDRDERIRKIYEIKKDIPHEKLCFGCPPEFIDFLKYSKELNFSQTPNYTYIQNLFNKMKNRIDNLSFSSSFLIPESSDRNKFLENSFDIGEEKVLNSEVKNNPIPKLFKTTKCFSSENEFSYDLFDFDEEKLPDLPNYSIMKGITKKRKKEMTN